MAAGADNRVVVEGAKDGLALDHGVLCEVFEREQATALADVVD